MNELIQELAKQSIANVRFWNAEKESYEVDRIELEKFAELIWAEAYDEGLDKGREEGFEAGYDQAQAAAERHYGADE